MHPRPVTLEGPRVRLVPMSLEHWEGLCQVGLHEEIWRWYPTKPIVTREGMRAMIEEALAEQAAGRQLPWVTLERASGRVLGSTRFLAIDPANRRVEIGWTWIDPAWQRSFVNTETKFLQLRHAFEDLGCIRVELKTDSLNDKSRRAIARLGAREEGTLRRHWIVAGGRVRDTVYYSVIAEEWPAVKPALEARIARG